MADQVISLPGAGAGGGEVLSVIHEELPLRPRTWGTRDVLELVGSGVAAACATATLFAILDWKSLVGAALWWFGLFLLIYRIEVSASHGGIVATDRMMTALIVGAATVTVGALAWMIAFVVAKGLPELRPGFFTQDRSSVGPLDPGGGAYHAIIGTLQQVGLATAVTVPLAIFTAVYLNEMRGRVAPVIRFFVDAMSGLPSIIAGLLFYTLWVIRFERGFSGAAAAGALAVLMLPTVTRTAEEILRTVDDGLRESALALGAPQWRMISRVVLPTARAGLITAAILGVARAVGETAPLLLTAFGNDSTNYNPANGPQEALPLFIFKLIRTPNETQVARAWTGALVLVVVIFVLFAVARLVGERSPAGKKLFR